MTAITLEIVRAKQASLAKEHTALASMIETLVAQSKPTKLSISGVEIDLRPGEHYAGAVLDADGKVQHHLVLMADLPDGDVNWKNATAWAESVGGVLPNRQEQALLYANCKPHMKPVWHWSCETHESDASYAWGCYFDYGNQGYDRKSAEGAARAVRRA